MGDQALHSRHNHAISHTPTELPVWAQPVSAQRRAAVIEALSSLVPERAGCSVLDVGAGRGELAADLAAGGWDVEALEPDPVLAAQIGARGLVVHLCSIEEAVAELGRERYDVVVASHVLEHTLAPLDALSALSALGRRYLVLAVPNATSLTGLAYAVLRRDRGANEGHVTAWDAPTLRVVLEKRLRLRIARSLGDVCLVAPQRSRLRRVPLLRRALAWTESRLLPRLLPLCCMSLVVVCELPPMGDAGR